MAAHYVTLPNGRKCGIRVYVRAWRTLLTADPAEQIKGFDYFPDRADRILEKLRYGLHDRINRHIPDYGRGRKWDSDYQIRLWRDSRRLRDIADRVRVYQFETTEARNRFADRLADRKCINRWRPKDEAGERQFQTCRTAHYVEEKRKNEQKI